MIITSEMIDAGVSILEDKRLLVENIYKAMAALAPAEEPQPEPEGLPWDIPAPSGIHELSSSLSNYLWNFGSDRAGNLNLMATYPVFKLPAENQVLYTVVSSLGNLNGESVFFRSDWNTYHSDKQIIIIDTITGFVYEFYKATVDHTNKKITATRADKLPVSQMQNPGSRGVGIPYHHMLITDEEVSSGVIPHALSLRVGNPKCNEAWYPASKVENHTECAIDGIPEGARFRCSFTPERINQWAATLGNLETFGRGLAQALQTYGFFITDNGSGYAAFDIQHPQSWSSSNPLKTTAVSSFSGFRDILDNLIQPEDFSLCVETGPRIIT